MSLTAHKYLRVNFVMNLNFAFTVLQCKQSIPVRHNALTSRISGLHVSIHRSHNRASL